jgi:hypothetical protein
MVHCMTNIRVKVVRGQSSRLEPVSTDTESDEHVNAYIVGGGVGVGGRIRDGNGKCLRGIVSMETGRT